MRKLAKRAADRRARCTGAGLDAHAALRTGGVYSATRREGVLRCGALHAYLITSAQGTSMFFIARGVVEIIFEQERGYAARARAHV